MQGFKTRLGQNAIFIGWWEINSLGFAKMDGSSSPVWMIFMALTLGLRHGLDLDHLATIDAITRTVRNSQFLSKLVGFLFSLGHGLVVILISLIIGSGLMKTHTPPWLEWVRKWDFDFLFNCFWAFEPLECLPQPLHKQLCPMGLEVILQRNSSVKRLILQGS